MTVYYNEIDPFAAKWLECLIKENLIANGIVDTRSIEDVTPSDLKGFTQHHFFAGIGGWSLALRNAGWSDDRPVWTGSCPCQPFSSTGQRTGFDDERHLWPAFNWLIKQYNPKIILGEQVASKDGLAWIDLVQSDLENQNYSTAAFDLCSAGVGSPNIRQRLYWLGYSHDKRLERHPRGYQTKSERETEVRSIAKASESGGMANTERSGHESGSIPEGGETTSIITQNSKTNGFWRDPDWLYFRDGKWRPVESGTFPLANGIPNRVGKLRGYGNAVNTEVARVFIESVMEVIDD